MQVTMGVCIVLVKGMYVCVYVCIMFIDTYVSVCMYVCV